MGLLFDSVKKVKLHQEKTYHKLLLERFSERGITHTPDGRKLDLLTYDELKSEAVLQSFRDIDTEKDSAKWF
ncbi:hypothetical protein [Fredinandcohnia sp. 179-A 10B2 NHS]|uniref:hypothetical protein n=1 Tax=Fredinandcohnia sp. 179-A 10B2 NHS TaxID=3235176 RepID=UPI0039A14016